jgi:hypothetical protein
MIRPVRARGTAAACLAMSVLAGCGGIPDDASVKDFCAQGEKFSASKTFATGKERAEALADTGTPKGIDADARKGFEELIDRVTSSEDGADFKKKADKLTDAEARHLRALDGYIKDTCDLTTP